MRLLPLLNLVNHKMSASGMKLGGYMGFQIFHPGCTGLVCYMDAHVIVVRTEVRPQRTVGVLQGRANINIIPFALSAELFYPLVELIDPVVAIAILGD